MRALGLVLLAACSAPAEPAAVPTRPMYDRASVCELIGLRVAGWRGLPDVRTSEAPECLGTRTETIESDPGSGFLERTAFHRDAIRVDLIGSGRAELVDIIPDTPASAATLLAQLGAPEARTPYDAELRRRKPIGAPGDTIDELVYASRGLALLIDEHGRLLRLRGFTPMSTQRYRAMYGQYHPVKFAP